jgi:hypothetical protein
MLQGFKSLERTNPVVNANDKLRRARSEEEPYA